VIKKTKKFLQTLFTEHFNDYQKRHKQPLKNIKAAEAIMNCRKSQNGSTAYHCPDGHETIDIAHACKHRSCPQCAAKSIKQWIDKQKQRLLPCEHYHLVFTLPHEYLGLWQYNRAWFIRTQFSVCHEVLMEMLSDKKHLGGKPGILLALHTWGRQLNLHPHIHALVAAGGLTTKNQWQPVKNNFLLPVRAVKAYYRGKFQARVKQALKDKALILPPDQTEAGVHQLIKRLYKKQWSVRIEEKYSHGKGVLLYLSRYLLGGPFKAQQIRSMDSEHIRFSYKDHREKRQKILTLSIDEFMRRILMHIPEPRIHTLRHYGLYASQARTARETCRNQLKSEQRQGALEEDNPSKEGVFQVLCKHCGATMLAGLTAHKRRRDENSYSKGATGIINSLAPLIRERYVQQGVQTELANAPSG